MSKDLTLPIFIVDAFATKQFAGNAAAVCLLEDWLSDEQMQQVATQNNQAETAFVCPTDDDEIYDIRWFSPVCEVPLCGHATLAASHVLFDLMEELDELTFHSQSGNLHALWHEDGSIALDFPAIAISESRHKIALEEALGCKITEAWEAPHHYMAVLASEADVVNAAPNMQTLAALDKAGVIITAQAEDSAYDIASRCFFPKEGIAEDHVTGSAHCLLTPYWAERLDKTMLKAVQRSPRGGELDCVLAGDRVHLSGQSLMYLEGRIVIKMT